MTQFPTAEVDAFVDAKVRSFAQRYPAVSVPALKEIIERGRQPRSALSIASIEERLTGSRVFEIAALLYQEAQLIADAVAGQEEAL
ncbi:MAG: hypothetical protein L0I80_02405 [Brevibacterium sp.]|uniref:hypothetical protein n=1 Tax=Brevibacterium sp. TaxID=1701 RepID=UPI0026477537|nr:hypothetical protein [Brevibacterium sp.]MDN5806477.1 hypothetical protein [Brevibacterium sp.]MDN5833203.1 hypothetical protein [Brevibacterium sp.]MDN5877299.1 hypothetical protein [Brevibacterium sp.]MDN5908696.1 hypothetical protein [Brevibacterium sp.]MDN6122712.1 hypothetical protein [Brevibacterium sp.]